MAIKVDLPKEILRPALEQALSLRERNARATHNHIIKAALEQEARAIASAIETLADLPPDPKAKTT